MKKSIIALIALIVMLSACMRETPIAPDIPDIPNGFDILDSDNIRFVESEEELFTSRFDTADQAHADETVSNFLSDQVQLAEELCPIDKDTKIPSAEFFGVVFPTRLERDKFITNLPMDRKIWYADSVTVVINRESVVYSAEVSIIVVEACAILIDN